MYGYAPEEAVGKPITIIVPEERREEVARFLATLKRGERVQHASRFRRPVGAAVERQAVRSGRQPRRQRGPAEPFPRQAGEDHDSALNLSRPGTRTAGDKVERPAAQVPWQGSGRAALCSCRAEPFVVPRRGAFQFSVEETRMTLGIAASRIAGLMGNSGTMTKATHCGHAARY